MERLVQDYAPALTSWAVGLLAILGTHSDSIVKGLGFVLLIARLVQEVPRAIVLIKKWWSK